MLKGFSLVELIVAIGLFSILIIGGVSLINLNNNSVRLATEYNMAQSYLNAGIEGVRNIKRDSWDDLNNGTYGLTVESGNYVLQAEPDEWDKYTRIIEIEDAYDADVKKITVTITWKYAPTKDQSVSRSFFLANWGKPIL